MSFRRALPDALDVMVICLEGGLSLPAALRYVAEDLRTAHPLLADELNIVQREVQLGLSPGESLRQLAQRTDLEEIRSLASVIIQADRLGASLVKSLRVHADTLRVKRRQRAGGDGPEGGNQDPLPHDPLHLPGPVRRHPRPGDGPDHGYGQDNEIIHLQLHARNRSMALLTRLNRQTTRSRRGAAATELAIIMPVFLLLFWVASIVGGM